MAQRVPVLSSKLLPPRTEGALERTISRHLSREIPSRKVTTVTAGAGYGKTTLVAQAVQGHDTVWYRLDSTDRDLATFMHHMTAGIGRIHPGFGRQIAGLMHEGQSLNLDPRGIITVFLQEMEDRLTRDVIFILDDFHAVGDSLPVRQALTFFMENLPPLVHLVIISLSEVPLPLSRLRAMREVLDVRTRDLLFSAEEVRHFAQQSFRVSLTEESTGILHEKTSGWVSALILFFHSLHRKTPHAIEQDIHAIKGSSRIISDYLDENVFSHLNREIRDFLLRTSILSRLNATFCDRYLGISNSSGILMQLERSHLFTFALDEDNQEYCYHQLFQEFLQNVLQQELGVDGTRLLHKQAACILEQVGNDEEAVHHYLMAGSFDEACAILDRLCLRLIAENRVAFIKSCVEKLPGHCFDAHPWMEYLRSCLHAFLGRYQNARKGIRRAMALFRDRRDQTGIDYCLKEIAFGNFMIGEFQKAQEIYEKILGSTSLTTMLHLEAHIQMVFINAQIGRMDASDTHADKALGMLDTMEDSLTRDGYHAWLMINHGFRYVFSGDPLKAMEMAETASAVLERVPSHRLMTYCHHLASSACLFQGRFRQGLDEALTGLTIMNRGGFHDTTRGWLLCNAGANALCLGLFDEALRYTENSLRFFQNGGNPFGMAYAYFTLQQFHLVTGRLELAEETGRTCLEVVRGLPMPHVTGPAKASLADTLILKGRLEEARELIEDARGAFRSSKTFEWMILRLYVRLCWAQGQAEDALAWLQKGLEIAEAHRFERVVALDWGWLLPMLLELYARGVVRTTIQEIFNTVADHARPLLVSLQRSVASSVSQAITQIVHDLPGTSPPGLNVRCLGAFRVMKGDQEIPASQWKSRKARMLFKLLVHYRSRGYVNKEIFMEHLWPEDDPGKTAGRFHVTLTTLRRILEPDLERGTPSSYLKADGDAYLLDLGRDGGVDIDRFHEACRKAKAAQDPSQAMGHLMEARQCYTGDFLEEDPFEPWCREERDRLRETYLSVLASIVDCHIMEREYDAAIETCTAYLELDPYAEDIYRELMRLYLFTGNRPMAVKTHERCVKYIVEDLGCPLSRETERLTEEMLHLNGTKG